MTDKEDDQVKEDEQIVVLDSADIIEIANKMDSDVKRIHKEGFPRWTQYLLFKAIKEIKQVDFVFNKD